MAIQHLSFSSTKDIQSCIDKLFTLDTTQLSYHEGIKKISEKLIITDTGQTIFYDDLLNDTDEEIKLAAKNGKWMTVAQAKQSSEGLIHNIPLAKVLYDIRASHGRTPYHFPLPKTKDKNGIISAPFITSEERSIERSQASSCGSVAYRNYALESLIWLRFSNYEDTFYNKTHLESDIEVMIQSVNQQLAYQNKLVTGMTKLRDEFKEKNYVPELANKNGAQLEQMLQETNPTPGDKVRFAAGTVMMIGGTILSMGITPLVAHLSFPLMALGPAGIAAFMVVNLLTAVTCIAVGFITGAILIKKPCDKHDMKYKIHLQQDQLERVRDAEDRITKAQAFQTHFEHKIGILSRFKAWFSQEKLNTPQILKQSSSNNREPEPQAFVSEGHNVLKKI